MYNPANFIVLDINKGLPLFKSLEQYNPIVKGVAASADYSQGYTYDLAKRQASFWFDPNQVRKTPMPKDYPKTDPIQEDPRLSLTLHIANYMSILIINALYADVKETIVIEDMCCGMGNLIFFLASLGFCNFSALDNFTQLPQWMFQSLMLEAVKVNPKFRYTLNNYERRPDVSNIVAYTEYIRRQDNSQPVSIENDALIPEPVELFLSYVPLGPTERSLRMNNDRFFEKYVCLARDPHRMIWAYCTPDKHKQFVERLQSYVCTK